MDSEGGGKMNAGVLVSTLRGTRGVDVDGSALGPPEKEGREKEKGTPDNSTV